MASNPPNRGGKSPSVSKQGKSGPITGSHSKVGAPTRPWTFGKGSSSIPKDKVPVKRVGASPSKTKGGWYMGGKKKS